MTDTVRRPTRDLIQSSPQRNPPLPRTNLRDPGTGGEVQGSHCMRELVDLTLLLHGGGGGGGRRGTRRKSQRRLYHTEGSANLRIWGIPGYRISADSGFLGGVSRSQPGLAAPPVLANHFGTGITPRQASCVADSKKFPGQQNLKINVSSPF